MRRVNLQQRLIQFNNHSPESVGGNNCWRVTSDYNVSSASERPCLGDRSTQPPLPKRLFPKHPCRRNLYGVRLWYWGYFWIARQWYSSGRQWNSICSAG